MIDYLHYDVGTTSSLTDPPIDDADPGDFVKFDDVDVVRVGINFKLGQRAASPEPLK